MFNFRARKEHCAMSHFYDSLFICHEICISRCYFLFLGFHVYLFTLSLSLSEGVYNFIFLKGLGSAGPHSFCMLKEHDSSLLLSSIYRGIFSLISSKFFIYCLWEAFVIAIYE